MSASSNPSDDESSLRRQVLECAYGTLSGQLTDALLPQRESERKEVIMRLAELDFKLRGGGKCACCNAPVRNFMRTVSENDRDTREFDCLCRRCLEAEKAFSRTVTVYFGGVVFESFVNKGALVQRGVPAKEAVAA
ncbi:MAG TPA: hypothetical protein VM056_05920 [Terriglobales bacterium]|nr:hypothetical protein [Terriglobales bacterium]